MDVSAVPSRIAVIGSSGSGKSTFAAALAAREGLPFVATDPVFWTSDWRPTPAADVRRWLESAAAAEQWVTDGNFDDLRTVLWRRAELVVWLDLPRWTTVGRAARRNLGWWLTRRPVWNGRPMTLAKALTGVRHAWRSHALKRRVYPAYLAELAPISVVRLRSAAAARAWLDQRPRSSAAMAG